MSGPNISQYFSNNPPSLFDEITVKNESDGNTAMTSNFGPSGILSSGSGIITPNIDSSNFLGTSLQQNEINVSDEVKDMWEPPHTEPGIPPLLTMPGVHSPNDLSDPVRDAACYLLGDSEASHRKILTADDVTQDERGLRQLIENGCFRSAVNLTGRLLTIYGQGYGRAGQPAKHSPHSLQLWFTRFALLTKLGQYELCQTESEPFGLLNRADVYYDFYPEMYSGRKGSMASFSFRLLLAELPNYLGSSTLSMDRLTDLAERCAEIKQYYLTSKQKDSAEFWQNRENRVLHSLVNCALLIKDFSLADYLMDKMISQPNLLAEQKRAIYSAWGRIYLQCGDVFGAEQKFSEARRSRDSNTALDLRDLVDKGLIAVAQNDFQAAYGFFENALKIDGNNTMLLNNMGVCKLYAGKLKEAITLFESAVNSNPQKGLNESLLLNLCTLYELESSNDVSKKLVLLKQINRHKADLNINLDFCLKLQTSTKIH